MFPPGPVLAEGRTRRTGLPAPRSSAQPKTRRWISQARSLIVQAGAFAEHTIRSVEHTVCADPSWTGDLYDYGHTPPTVTVTSATVDGPWLRVELARSTTIRLTLRLDLRTRVPSYRTPFG
ncbi:hypothetical protein AB5J72_00695 [Streptomyces sp. CG1]|uniref:hypothetical protein n=1 Tax=Streptomyces sp. CG1 TaxID=1287523 RepID=UPI0034E2F498